MYKQKKEAFAGLGMTIVTPSHWLAGLVKESFLKDYPVQVIHNGIDLNVFQPRPSNFREKYHIAQDKFLLLGVAVQWVPRKGADAMIRLAQKLNPEKFQIVLVGTDDTIDQQLPSNIISIHRTSNQTELAEIYTAADLFVNPTREDTFPTVNMESLACGTPVLTYRTGGSPEMLDDSTGKVVDCDDEEALYQAVLSISDHPFERNACLRRAADFDEKDRFYKYVELYRRVLG